MARRGLSTIVVVMAVLAGGCADLAIRSAPEKTASVERTSSARSADDLFCRTLHNGEYEKIPEALTAPGSLPARRASTWSSGPRRSTSITCASILRRPHYYALQSFQLFFHILPNEYHAKVGVTEFGKKPIGTGPYRVASFEEDAASSSSATATTTARPTGSRPSSASWFV